MNYARWQTILILLLVILSASTWAFTAQQSKSFHSQLSYQNEKNYVNPATIKSNKRWKEMLPKLKEFRNQRGHTMVGVNDDPELYKWTLSIRRNYKHQLQPTTTTSSTRQRLSVEKLNILQDLQFSWDYSEAWEKRLQELYEYATMNGHVNVTTTENAGLAYFCRAQQRDYRRMIAGNATQMTQERAERLERIGMQWTTPTAEEREQPKGFRYYVRQWNVMIPRLRKYREERGNSIVNVEDDPELYRWTVNIRKNYRHQLRRDSNSTSTSYRPRLSSEKLKTLEDLEFCWDLKERQWDQRFQELSKFKKRFGHCTVSVGNSPRLGVFCQNQRREYRKLLAGNRTQLTPERMAKLESIGFEWQRSHSEAWKERRSDLMSYVQEYGHANVPQDFDNNFRLGQWSMNQRSGYRYFQAGEQTGLTEERIKKLEEMDFQWSYRESRWMRMYERLKAYQEEHEHVNVGTTEEINQDLRLWLNYQRYFYHRKQAKQASSMTDKRIELLEAIPNFSWRWRDQSKGPSQEDWSQLFVAIREKGVAPEGKAKRHWFDGMNPFEMEVKNVWTEEELVDLFNSESGDEDEDYDDDEHTEGFLKA